MQSLESRIAEIESRDARVENDKQAAIIHGRQLRWVLIPGGPRNMAFLPHSEQKLRELWFQVERPNLTQPENPQPAIWRPELYKLLKDKRLAIAYSMGTVMTLDTLTQYPDLSLDCLILVWCSWWAGQYIKNDPALLWDFKHRMNAFPPAFSWLWRIYGNIVGQTFIDRMCQMQEQSSIDPTAVTQRVRKIVFILSDNDRIVPLSHGYVQAEKLWAHVIVCHKHGHFTRGGELSALSEYLERIINHTN